MPRVSVIIAARNAEQTLPGTLASIASQSYRDWEVVAVDDGSNDTTRALVDEFRAGPVQLLRNDRQAGPGAARNRAVQHASGELIATLDADDRWLPNYLERQVARYDEAVAAGERVGLVACNARLLGSDGELRDDTWADRVGPVAPATLARMLAVNRVCSTVLMPRAVFGELGGYDASIWRGEDYDLWLRLLEAGYAIVANQATLAVYRFSQDGLTAASAAAAASTRLVYERALERGHLGPRERRVARRARRLFKVLEARASGRGRDVLPLTALVALEHPGRWRQWLRRGPRPAGSGRHA